VCVCVCACVRACVRACVCYKFTEYMDVALLFDLEACILLFILLHIDLLTNIHTHTHIHNMQDNNMQKKSAMFMSVVALQAAWFVIV
jgi:hypothetical protein